MSGGAYLLQDDGKLVEMPETPYDTEDLLQGLLANYPSLLAGDQVDASAPRRWVLVCREAGVPDVADGSGRWSLDHLFLDQDAVPTLVEVKRSADTRIRREVVGQMLDYAANAVAYWPVATIRAQFEARCQAGGIDPDEQLADLLGPDADTDRFWQTVGTNLQAGRIRLVFVADTIPPELQRIIEFLNGQMRSAEVLGVAIRHYAAEGRRVLVPRVVGQTAAAQQQRSVARGPERQWDEASFFEELAKKGPVDVRVARRLLDWARTRGLRFWWGHGKQYGSCFPLLDWGGSTHWTICVWTDGRLEVQFGMLMKSPPFDGESARRELQRRLLTVEGVVMPAASVTKRPPIALAVLAPEPAIASFLAAMDWVLDVIRAGTYPLPVQDDGAPVPPGGGAAAGVL